MINQLALNIQLRDDATLANYYPGDNQIVLTAIEELVDEQVIEKNDPYIYIWGQMGAGKTHLLQAACHAANDNDLSSIYISFETNKKPTLEFLQDIDAIKLICLDNIQNIVGLREWEESLFHLFNQIRLNQGYLLIAADLPPSGLPIALADLKSRLSWGVVYHLQNLNDEQKLAALQLRAQQRGLQLDDTVGKFLLTRCHRTMAELYELLQKLDKASLTQQRKLTIPFVKQVLGF